MKNTDKLALAFAIIAVVISIICLVIVNRNLREVQAITNRLSAVDLQATGNLGNVTVTGWTLLNEKVK
jgi:hypothetical protein